MGYDRRMVLVFIVTGALRRVRLGSTVLVFCLSWGSLTACTSDPSGSGSSDSAVYDAPSLFFQDTTYPEGRQDGAETLPDAVTSDADGLVFRDGASSDGEAPDLVRPDVLQPDLLSPDLMPPDTLAHQCTTTGEFNCQPMVYWSTCWGTCKDHHQRTLGITCLATVCQCYVNNKVKKTCPNTLTGCPACDKAMTCCDFENL